MKTACTNVGADRGRALLAVVMCAASVACSATPGDDATSPADLRVAPNSTRAALVEAIFTDDFEGDLSQWTVVGDCSITGSSTNSGGECRGTGDSSLTARISTVGYTDIQVSYGRVPNYQGRFAWGETFGLYWSSDGGSSWNTVEQTSSSGWANVSFNLPAATEGQSDLRLAWYTNASPNNALFWMDDVVVTGDRQSEPMCGNGVVEGDERCDGNCPTACDDGDACTNDTLTGSAGNCDAECTHGPKTACSDGDGCCPTGCDAGNDDDCAPSGPVCEDGDGSCPVGCDFDNDDDCPPPGPVCEDGDGSCPVGCDASNDDDCAPSGPTCQDGDGACPSGCSASNDSDCGAVPCMVREPVLSENFNVGFGAINAYGYCQISAENQGAWCWAGSGNKGILVANVSTQGFTDLTVSYQRVPNLEGNENDGNVWEAMWSPDAHAVSDPENNATWHTIETSSSPAWSRGSFDLPSGAENLQNLQLVFFIESGPGGGSFWIDDILLTGVHDNPAACPAECGNSQQCDDGNPCTASVCQAGDCKHFPDASLPGCSCTPEVGHLPSNDGSTCSLPVVPLDDGALRADPAYPNLGDGTFVDPVQIVFPPDGSNRAFVVEQQGRIWVLPNDENVSSPQVQLYLDITSSVWPGSEAGLLGMAFDPEFSQTGRFYLNYTGSSGGQRQTVLARHTEVSATSANPNGQILLTANQPYDNHNGGGLGFGPDGYLYMAIGDGGSQGDPSGNGQNTNNLLAAILRLDVSGNNYSVPNDNPFVSGGGRPEIYAYGLRNPWRFSWDSVTGTMWAGDVGQWDNEEINKIVNGGNYGWNITEGAACYGSAQCSTAGLTPPELEYPHSVGPAVIGGYVYRGSQQPSLYGAYIYGDYAERKIFVYRESQGPPLGHSLILPSTISSFGEDPSGELYVVGHGKGTIYKLEENTPAPFPSNFPDWLSETGCFDNLVSLRPAAGVVPYDVNTPLWSDGAAKKRYVVLPAGKRLGFSSTGKWSVPTGTILIKHFEIERVQGDPSSLTRLETRFILHQEDGLASYTYRWNSAGTDAYLIDEAESRSLTLSRPGAPAQYTWEFPGRDQCGNCHTPASTGVLGLETGQLNGLLQYGGECAPRNQLDALAAYGVLDQLTSNPNNLARFPSITDGTASLSGRARAYLHSNCANCHLPGGPAGTSMDLRVTTSLPNTNACNVAPTRADLGLSDPRLIHPGNANNSVTYLRATGDADMRMPPLATSIVDAEAGAVLSSWIDSLGGCSGP